MAVEERGIQPAESISALLSEARAGLLHYPVDYLTKSGIWSGYVAHGVLPVILSSSHSTRLIEEGKHFIRWDIGEHSSLTSAETSAQTLSHWYQKNASSDNAACQFLDAIAYSALTHSVPESN